MGDPGERLQPVTPSQIVEVTTKKPGDANDQSVAWKGTVVGADEFAPAPKRSRAKWVIAGVLVVGAAGGVAYALWPAPQQAKQAAQSDATTAQPAPAQTPAPAQPAPAQAPAPAPADAALPATAAPSDAAAPPPDAATAAPATKKPAPAKKHVTKKRHK